MIRDVSRDVRMNLVIFAGLPNLEPKNLPRLSILPVTRKLVTTSSREAHCRKELQ